METTIIKIMTFKINNMIIKFKINNYKILKIQHKL